MNADIDGEIAWRTVATAAAMEVDEIDGVLVLTRPEHLLRSRESKGRDPLGKLLARLLESVADYLNCAFFRGFHLLQNSGISTLQYRDGRYFCVQSRVIIGSLASHCQCLSACHCFGLIDSGYLIIWIFQGADIRCMNIDMLQTS